MAVGCSFRFVDVLATVNRVMPDYADLLTDHALTIVVHTQQARVRIVSYISKRPGLPRRIGDSRSSIRGDNNQDKSEREYASQLRIEMRDLFVPHSTPQTFHSGFSTTLLLHKSRLLQVNAELLPVATKHHEEVGTIY
jgi:hypothetical protein